MPTLQLAPLGYIILDLNSFFFMYIPWTHCAIQRSLDCTMQTYCYSQIHVYDVFFLFITMPVIVKIMEISAVYKRTISSD